MSNPEPLTTLPEAVAYTNNSTAWTIIYTLAWSQDTLYDYLFRAEAQRVGNPPTTPAVPTACNDALTVVIGILNGSIAPGDVPSELAQFNNDYNGKYAGLEGPNIPTVAATGKPVEMRFIFDNNNLSSLLLPPFGRIPKGALQMVPYAL